MIVKCQRSLSTEEPVPQLLVYNRNRQFQWMGPLTDEWSKRFGRSPEGAKFYADVEWKDKSKPPRYLRRVRQQKW